MCCREGLQDPPKAPKASKNAETSKESTSAIDPHYKSSTLEPVKLPKRKTERALLPFEEKIAERRSSTAKKYTSSKEYKSLHDLHESIVQGTPARLLHSRKNKQTFESGRQTQLSFLNQGSKEQLPPTRASSDYEDDFLDDDFPSPSALVAQQQPHKALCKLPEDEFGLDDLEDVIVDMPEQKEKAHPAPWSGSSSKTVIDDSKSKQLFRTPRDGSEILEAARKTSLFQDGENHDESFSIPCSQNAVCQPDDAPQDATESTNGSHEEDNLENEECLTTPSSPKYSRHEKHVPLNVDTLTCRNYREDDEKLFLTSSPVKPPDYFCTQPKTDQTTSGGSKRLRSISSEPDYEEHHDKKQKNCRESRRDRAPLTVDPSSQNSQSALNHSPKKLRSFESESESESERKTLPSSSKSLAGQEDRQKTDTADLIPKSSGNLAGIDLSLLAEFADYGEFE